MKNQLIASLILAFILVSCQQQAIVPGRADVRKAPAPTSFNGFYYFLPRTVISVDVTIVKTISQPGPFAGFAESLLGLQDVIRMPSVQYRIAEISIHGYAEPDPDQMFFIAMDQVQEPFFISLSEAGLLQSINKPFDSGLHAKNPGEMKEYGQYGTEATFNHFIDSNLQERIDTILERVRVDTMTIERQTLRRSWVEKPTEVRAREVADYILKIRNKKFELISGFAEIPYSKEAIRYMYEEMNRKENDYVALFTGLSSSASIKYRYTWVPDRTRPIGPQTLFHFSQREGVVAENVPGSIPVTIEAQRAQASSYLSSMVQRLPDPKNPNRGFYYRIPEHSTIMIREGRNLRAEARMLINQFGVVTSLPPYMLEVEFYPNTGSVKSIGWKPSEN